MTFTSRSAARPRTRVGRFAHGGWGFDLSEVYVGESESLDAALRRFNKRVQADGILTDVRRHEYYEKPSERRKKKEASRRRKLRKALLKQKQRREF